MLEKLVNREHLTPSEAEYLVEGIINNVYSPVKAGALLTALRMKGETVDEIFSFAKVMRRFCFGIDVSEFSPLLDTCGTGGDGSGTFNISTAVAIIAAACGVKVTKHGNRASSSKCGSADVLEALGVNISIREEALVECLKRTNFCFLFARTHHQAMNSIAPIRKELGIRTIFNLLGPLTNPARATHQLIGLFSPRMLESIARVASRLGAKRAIVVHGDGLDEFTTTAPSHYVELSNNEIQSKVAQPEDFEIPLAKKEDLKGGDAARNAEIMKDIYSGKKGPKRDITVLNAGAALYVAERAASIREGIDVARENIDNGQAMKTLEAIVEFTKNAENR